MLELERYHFESHPITELDNGRHRFSGQPLELLTGGSGMFGPAPGPAPQNANGAMVGANSNAAVQPHHGPIALLVFAVLVLFLLDRAGFRFAVTAGKR